MTIPIAPGVYSGITDKSGYSQEGVTPGFYGMFPIASLRGKDNSIVFKPNFTKVLKEFLEPKYNKFGLSHLIALQWFRGGSAGYLCRLLPSDALYANTLVTMADDSANIPAANATWKGFHNAANDYAVGDYVLKDNVYYKSDEIIAAEEFNIAKWTIVPAFSATATYIATDPVEYNGHVYEASGPVTAGAFDIADWTLIFHRADAADLVAMTFGTSDAYSSQANIDADIDLAANFMSVFPTGRGADYNKLSWSITLNESLADTYSFAMYDINFFDLDSNGFLVGIEDTYTVSFDPDAVDVTGQSLFVTDYIEKYSDMFRVVVNNTDFEDLVLPLVQTHYDPAFLAEDLYSFDLFKDAYQDVKYSLASGSEGTLLDANGRFDNAVFEGLVVDMYAGTLDPRISNFKEIQAKVIFDAGFSVATKTAMSNFTSTLRTDIFAYLDSLFQQNEDQELSFRSDDLSINNFRAGIQGGNFVTYEPYSGKDIQVPALYQVCFNISRVWNSLGVHVPVAGYNARGNIDGVKRDTLAYNPPAPYRNQLYLKQMNVIVKDPSGVYRLSTLTSQKKASALSNESIVNMVQVIDVELTLFSEKFLFDFITPEVFSDIDNQVNDYFVKWFRNNGVEQVEVNVYASELDKKNKTVRVDVSIWPTSFIEKLIFNFIIK